MPIVAGNSGDVIFQYRPLLAPGRVWVRLVAVANGRQASVSRRAVAVSLLTDRGVPAAHNRTHGSNRTAGTASPASTVRDFAMRRGSISAIGVCVAVLKVLLVLFLLVMTAVAATIAAARTSLPNTCAVSEAQFDQLSMQMNYDAVRKLLGCEGVLVAKEDYGQIIVEHFAWRGAAWPYGRLRLEFINNTLQGTQKLWLNLSLARSH
jgi:hypothetical protein